MIKKLLLLAGLAASSNAMAANQDWAWYPVASSQEQTFIQTRENQNRTISTRTVTVATSAWAMSTGKFDCSDWSPNPSTQPIGSSFTQTRSCTKNRFRNWTYNADGDQIHLRVEWDKVSQTESRNYTGAGDTIVSQYWDSWSDWTNVGALTSCGSWSPDPASVDMGLPFIQSRTCSQQQRRKRDRVNEWSSGRITRDNQQTETRTVTVTDTQGATGRLMNGYIYSHTDSSEWSAYYAEGGYNTDYCEGFSYPPDRTVSFYADNDCSIRERRNVWDVYYHIYTDREVTRNARQETRTREATEQVYVVVDAGAYLNKGGVYNCGNYSPALNRQKSSFIRYRSCDQDQTRSRTYRVSGNLVFATTDERTINNTTSQYINVTNRRFTKVETEPQSDAWAYAYCLDNAPPNRTVNTATNGEINTYSERRAYYYSPYSSHNWSTGWSEYNRTESATCTYRRFIDLPDCGGPRQEICD